MVKDQFDCTFLCVAVPTCYSFNIAAYADSKGLYLCKLLAADKYTETRTFHANATFHHYSTWVSDKRIYFTLAGRLRTLFFVNASFLPSLQTTGKTCQYRYISLGCLTSVRVVLVDANVSTQQANYMDKNTRKFVAISLPSVFNSQSSRTESVYSCNTLRIIAF